MESHMIDLKSLEVWFVTGSQHLYGDEVLKQVAKDSQAICAGIANHAGMPVRIEFKPVMVGPDAIRDLCQEANRSPNCIGLVTWMHTFSPAKMWIAGLSLLKKPFLHLHTQFNRDIPWSTIDMNFMNLNQSAHGDREFGFICSRMRKGRSVVVGHWQDERVLGKIAAWSRVAAAWHDWQNLKIARFGDNMRQVAVTEGDKVEAQMRFGYAVNGYGVGDLVAAVNAVSDADVDRLCGQYEEQYEVAAPLRKNGDRRSSLRDAARIELGLKSFLESGGFGAFTDTFEDLHGLKQLPGVAAQRLMAAGYGFGGEGDWKTSALVRAMKVMSHGLAGGTSFMEDYTYHFDPARPLVLGAHMLEICPSIAGKKPSLEIHPLGIGGKEDPVRLVFDAPPGPAINVAMLDLGGRFRMLVNEVDVVAPIESLPKLPVARALWHAKPNLETAAATWILAGGPHHTSFSQAVTTDQIEAFAEMAGVELLVIDNDTKVRDFKNEIRWNDAYFRLKQ
jgi:L-arabinose isomerase